LEVDGGVVSQKGFAAAIRILLDRGFRFTVIGGTVVELSLGSRDLGDDVDVFGEEPSPLFEDEYRAAAEELGWSVGQTWLGTPRVIARVGEEEIPIEFYDNIHDFYVPEPMLERAERVTVAGVRVKMVTLEDHLALKAHAGRSSDMERLKEIGRLARKGRLKIDRRRLEEAVSFFEDASRVVARRLREAGLL
jgi:predicted nucleotidyltransferase